MSARRLLIALCVALAGLGILAPSHSLADDPAGGPDQVQAPIAAKAALSSQAPASAALVASPAPAAVSAPSAAAPTTSGVAASPPVISGAVASQPVSVAPAASSSARTPAVLMPPPIPSFPELSPATTGAVTAHGSVPVVLASNNLNEVAAPAGGTNAPFSAVLGISATRPDSAGAVPATIVSQSSSAVAAESPSQAVSQAQAVAAGSPSQAKAPAVSAATPKQVVSQAPAAAAEAPKGPYVSQAPGGVYAAAPKGPYAGQAATSPSYAAAAIYPSGAGASVGPAQVSAVPGLPNTGTGGLLDRHSMPVQAPAATPGILAGLLLAALLGAAAGLSPSRRAHPVPAVRRTSGRIYWLNETLR